MPDEPFGAIAIAANAVPMDEAHVRRHLALVADINATVARAALAKLTLAASPWSFATLRTEALVSATAEGGAGDTA